MGGEWLLNVYTIKSNAGESIIDSEKRALIEKHLLLIEKNCMSNEFDYYKVGFAFYTLETEGST